MTHFRQAVCGRGCLGILAVAWGFLGGMAVAEPARDGSNPGRELFFREWMPGDARSHGGDGLGPLYNETSCVACHNLGAPGGAGPASKNVQIVSLLLETLLRTRLAGERGELDAYHPGFRDSSSLVIHRFGTDPEYKAWRLKRFEGVELEDMAEEGPAAEIEQIQEALGPAPGAGAQAIVLRALRGRMRTIAPSKAKAAEIRRIREALKLGPDARDSALGERPERMRTTAPSKGEILFSTVASLTQRNPPPLFGAGLIDSIPVEALRAAAAYHDPEFPEVDGRLILMEDMRVGRFGWKAQTASLKEFVESACAMELGLEVPTHHQAKPPFDFTRRAAGLDLNQEECDALTAFVAALPAPIERGGAGEGERPEVKAGRALFARAGCAACHFPQLGPVAGIYSDLMLHDMGPDLADSGSYYGATEASAAGGADSQEWRTPPLWGFRDSGPYLHDGRAETLEEAVALHGGQAARSARRYFALKLIERLQVQTFLNSLAAPAVERGP